METVHLTYILFIKQLCFIKRFEILISGSQKTSPFLIVSGFV